MNGNDGRRGPEWPIDPNADKPPTAAPRAADVDRDTTTVKKRRGISPILLALGGLVLLLMLAFLFTGNRSSDQDKLIGNEAEEANPAGTAEERCASRTTYDLIKRELFRRAAQVRGSDQAAFDRLSAYAVVRMENPVLESENEDSGAINCSGSLSLDLPPGVAVVGGRRTLATDLDYTVQPAADGSGQVVLLRNADAVITPLATLARVGQTGVQPTMPAPPADGAPPVGQVPSAEPIPAPPAQPDAVPEPPSRPSAARPSFNCANASTRGEIAVCRDAGLAGLDRQMAAQFYRALERAGPEERALLQRTRSRFLSYRDGCRSNGCIADAYRGRMREISDIMAGRWQPPR